MDRAELEKMKLEALRLLATERGIDGAGAMGRAQLIDKLAAPSRANGLTPAAFFGRAKEAVAKAAQLVEEKMDRLEEKVAALADKMEGKARELADELHRPEAPRGATAAKDQRRGPSPASGRQGFDVPSSTVHPHADELETLTMARRYAAEGQLDRALELYTKLSALAPNDASLKQERERLLEQRGAVTPPEPPPPPPSPSSSGEPLFMLDLEELPETYGVDECEVLYKDPFWVFAYWEITENGLAAARAQLGPSASSARLVMRLFTTVATQGGVERHIQDADLSWNHGRRYLQAPKPGAHLRIAVGLLSQEGYFAPIAHSSLVRVPSPEPGPEGPVEWMEVVPNRSREREPLVIVRRGQDHEERGAPSGDRGGDGGTSPGGRWKPGAWNPGSGSGGVT